MGKMSCLCLSLTDGMALGLVQTETGSFLMVMMMMDDDDKRGIGA